MKTEENVLDAAKVSEEEQPPKKTRARTTKAAKPAKAAELKPYLCVQYEDVEADVDSLVEAAKAEFRKEKKRTPIKELKLYIKPEERAAYFVINESFSGKVDF